MPEVECTGKQGVFVIRIAGRLDAAASTELEGACSRAIAGGAQTLILDMSGLRYVSSAGLRVVLSAAKDLQGRGGLLRIAGLSGMAREVFDLSGLTTLFPQHDSVETALSAAG